jgi:hypothetical protein
MKAPKGKIAFIESLQPFFLAGEVSFAKELPALVQQFLAFPTGRIDAPNALAYALRMRPGLVVYDDFSSGHVVEDLSVRARAPVWLCLNTDGGVTTGVVAQVVDGALHVLGDYVREGDPGSVLGSIVVEAKLSFDTLRLVAGPRHYDSYDRLGLRGAVAKLPSELRRGGSEEVGRDEIRGLLRRQVRGNPAFVVSTSARWVLNGLAAGYARAVDKRGVVSEDARLGVYRTLIEGLETFTALMKIGTLTESIPNVRMTEGGQRYVSALPSNTVPQPAKDEFLRDFGAVTGRGQLSAKR